MAWDIEVTKGYAIVRMNTNKVNVQNAAFSADLHQAFDRLEREFGELPVVLTGQGSAFSAGEPERLLDTAIDYARCITPDCNTAYAMSKKALQDGVVRQIDERTVALDSLISEGMSDPGNRRAQDRRRNEIMNNAARSV